MQSFSITKEKALEILKKYIKNQNLIKHCIASWAVMRKIAEKFDEDVEKWSLAGLLHDIDVEITNGITEHTKKAVVILKEIGIDDDVIQAIKMHNPDAWGFKSEEKFHIALRSAETITGLIVALALVMPNKKISEVKVESVLKRFKEKRFASGVNRDAIVECEKIGIPLNEFVEISINAMKEVSDELGL